MNVEASRRLNYAAVHTWATGGDYAVLSAAAKLKAGRLARQVAEEGMVLHGASGYVQAHRASRFVRDARLFSIANGSDEAMLMTLGKRGVADGHDSTSSPLGRTLESFRAAIAEVIKSTVRPRLAAWMSSGALPVSEVLRTLANEGCLGAGFPPHLGGIGGSLWHSAVLHEELARLGSSALGTAVMSHLEVGTRLVADHAARPTAERWVPTGLRGAAVFGYAATEESCGSDLAATTTSARHDGDSWVIDGRKKFITNAPQADALCVLVRTSDRAVTSPHAVPRPNLYRGSVVLPAVIDGEPRNARRGVFRWGASW